MASVRFGARSPSPVGTKLRSGSEEWLSSGAQLESQNTLNHREGCLNPSSSQMSCRAIPIAVAKLFPFGWRLNPVMSAFGGRFRGVTFRSSPLCTSNDRAEDVHFQLACGVVASMPSPNDTKAMPSACSSSSSVMRCLRFRPRRSAPDASIEEPAPTGPFRLRAAWVATTIAPIGQSWP
jgi:hypothetical protein